MGLFDWFKDKINSPGKHFIYHAIDTEHTDTGTQTVSIQPNRDYFRLWLSEMYLKDDVRWFQEWYPAVHSLVKFTFGGKQVVVPYIGGTLNLEQVRTANNNVVQMTLPMTTLMPFNGGVVEITAGLLAMKGDNFLNNFIGVLGNFSTLLVVPQLSAALAIAGPIVSGIQTLIGNDKEGALKIGMNKGFGSEGGGGSNDLKSGYIAVIAAEADKIHTDRLWIVGDRLHYGDTLQDNKPLTGVTYMLFRIEGRSERDDWDALTSIAVPFNRAIEALGQQDLPTAQSQLHAAVVATLQSPDLTKADRSRVAKAIKAEFDQAKIDFGLNLTTAAGQTDLLTAVVKRAENADTALSQPPVTINQLFGSP